jgi:hypothetical protein
MIKQETRIYCDVCGKDMTIDPSKSIKYNRKVLLEHHAEACIENVFHNKGSNPELVAKDDKTYLYVYSLITDNSSNTIMNELEKHYLHVYDHTDSLAVGHNHCDSSSAKMYVFDACRECAKTIDFSTFYMDKDDDGNIIWHYEKKPILVETSTDQQASMLFTESFCKADKIIETLESLISSLKDNK